MKTGYIEITDKVRFVFHELVKPFYKNYGENFKYTQEDIAHLQLDMKEYEASKQTVEVSNAKHYHPNSAFEYWRFNMETIKDGQKCKAEVNGIAKIIELIK